MRPQNLLFIFSDEHTREITGCYGHDVIQTPNIDALAERGTRFNNAYTNCPICVPARASLATGRYVHQIRYWDNAFPYHGTPQSFGHRLMEQGHHVTAIGKLHYRSNADSTGWNEEIDTLHVIEGIGDLAGCIRTNMTQRTTVKNLARDAGRGDSTYIRYDTRSAEHAVRWLKEEAPRHRDRPWMLFVGFVLPHFPLIAPPTYYDMYPQLPPPRLYDVKDRPTHPVIRELARVQAYDKYFDEERVRIARTAYFAMVSYLDHCIGQVLRALNASGLEDETRVIYTTDHGDNIGHRGLWGKSNMYEESAAIPMIVAGADVPAGHVVDAPVSLVDCYPTILHGAGIAPSDEEQEQLPGCSLLDLANGATVERTVLSEYHAAGACTGMFMIRHGRFKYVHYVDYPPQLFDLDADPHETVDRASDPAMADTLTECEARLRQVVNPEQASATAFADQDALVARFGGREQVLTRGDFGYTPAPGESPQFS